MRSTTTATHAGFYGRRAGFAGYLVEVAPSGEALFGSISHAAVFSALEDAAAVAGSIPNGTIAERLAIGGNFGGNFGAATSTARSLPMSCRMAKTPTSTGAMGAIGKLPSMISTSLVASAPSASSAGSDGPNGPRCGSGVDRCAEGD